MSYVPIFRWTVRQTVSILAHSPLTHSSSHSLTACTWAHDAMATKQTSLYNMRVKKKIQNMINLSRHINTVFTWSLFFSPFSSGTGFVRNFPTPCDRKQSRYERVRTTRSKATTSKTTAIKLVVSEIISYWRLKPKLTDDILEKYDSFF